MGLKPRAGFSITRRASVEDQLWRALFELASGRAALAVASLEPCLGAAPIPRRAPWYRIGQCACVAAFVSGDRTALQPFIDRPMHGVLSQPAFWSVEHQRAHLETQWAALLQHTTEPFPHGVAVAARSAAHDLAEIIALHELLPRSPKLPGRLDAELTAERVRAGLERLRGLLDGPGNTVAGPDV